MLTRKVYQQKAFYYLDNAATTPLSHEALEAMVPYLTEDFGNASTIYTLGQRAKQALEESRRTIAETIGAKPQEIYFTSGGTESDNWALVSAMVSGRQRLLHEAIQRDPDAIVNGHLITDKIEHHAILRTCKYLESLGFDITYLDVDSKGHVDPRDVEAAIRPDTILISVMMANNEIGTLEPVTEIGRVAHDHGILFHTDAVQAYGHIPIQVSEMNIDLMSASAHKLNGPKGVGFLYMRRGVNLKSFMHGGAQERGFRAGTENVAGIVGFARAAETACASLRARNIREQQVRDHLIARLTRGVKFAWLNGDPVDRLPNNINITFQYIEAETLLLLMNEKKIYASAGSACASGSLEPSHVLLALGVSREDALGSIRLSIDPDLSIEDADYLVDTLKPMIERLRRQSSRYLEAIGELPETDAEEPEAKAAGAADAVDTEDAGGALH